MDDNGCTDGNCKLRIGKCQGQHTNGGCRCLRDIPTPLRLRIEKKLAAVTKGRNVLESRLRNLLAVIHRDGGHHTEKHGMGKASEDAIDLVANTRGERDELRELVKSIRENVEHRGHWHCLVCREEIVCDDDHEEGCELSAALKGGE